MTIDQVRRTLRERIARGAPISEIDTLLRMSRGIGQRQREALWAEAARYRPRRVTLRQVDNARRFLGRGESNGDHGGQEAAKPRAARRSAASGSADTRRAA